MKKRIEKVGLEEFIDKVAEEIAKELAGYDEATEECECKSEPCGIDGFEISEDDAFCVEGDVSDRMISLLDLFIDFQSCNAVCSEWTPRRVCALLLRQPDVLDEDDEDDEEETVEE